MDNIQPNTVKLRKSDKSITTLIGRGMFSILTLASVLTVVSLVALTLSLSDASSVNKAGSLRMYSYRIAYQLSNDYTQEQLQESVAQVDQTIADIANNIIDNWDVTEELKYDFNKIESGWHRYRAILLGSDPEQFLTKVEDFVVHLDELVNDFQYHSEFKVKVITLVKGFGIGLIFAVAMITMRLMREQMTKPLRKIFNAATQIRCGNFDVSFDMKHKNEISELANTVAYMAADLDKLYLHLEEQVNIKTQELQKANDRIEFLYKTSQALHVTTLEPSVLEGTLKHLCELNKLSYYELVLISDESEPIHLQFGARKDREINSFELRLGEHDFGNLKLLQEECQQLKSKELQYIESYCQIISRSQYYSQSSLQMQRNLLMEERAVIARELHDSLAQALSYLKIQVTLLKRQLKDQPIPDSVNTIVDEIDTNLKLSYTQLRELLNTFRLTLEDANIAEAIRIMLAQLRTRTQSQILLNYELNEHIFSPNEHIHILQIIREAVLNSIKHANSTKIKVDCCINKNGTIEVSISDDGDGIPADPTKANHYGLNIMDERASKLGAKLRISNNVDKGTLVLLTFDRGN